ncbi:MAG TPA: LTA synthase family protein, partial [Methylotenera sp.]|nr:LTA synthase family protein [Methylotenera sp.]
WMEESEAGKKVVVLRAGKVPAHGLYDVKRKKLTEVTPPQNPKALAEAKAMEQRALANSLLPNLLYNEQRYRLP